jgi:hypothetical protein
MQFIRAAGLDPGLGSDLFSGIDADDAQRGGMAQVVRLLADCASATVLGITIIQESIGSRVDELCG